MDAPDIPEDGWTRDIMCVVRTAGWEIRMGYHLIDSVDEKTKYSAHEILFILPNQQDLRRRPTIHRFRDINPALAFMKEQSIPDPGIEKEWLRMKVLISNWFLLDHPIRDVEET